MAPWEWADGQLKGKRKESPHQFPCVCTATELSGNELHFHTLSNISGLVKVLQKYHSIQQTFIEYSQSARPYMSSGTQITNSPCPPISFVLLLCTDLLPTLHQPKSHPPCETQPTFLLTQGPLSYSQATVNSCHF